MKPKEWVYRCVAYYQSPVSLLESEAGESVKAVTTMAYGTRPERKHVENAINDMLVLKAQSMKDNTHRSPFFATVVAYVKGGSPPEVIYRQVYMALDGLDLTPGVKKST